MVEVSAHGILAKFEFYFVALIFTILGLALQTADFGDVPSGIVIVEIVGWVFLIASGLVGLSKVKWIASTIMVRNRKEFLSDLERQIRITQAQGQTHVLYSGTGKQVPIKEMLGILKESEEKADKSLLRLGRLHEIKEHTQWWGFVMAIVLIALSRVGAALC